MIKCNAANERIKRRYLQFLKDVKGRDESSIDAVAKAIDRFEEHSKHRDFRKFHVEQARAFKAQFMATRNARTGAPLSASTIHSTLATLKAFFAWLAQEPGYRARIKFADAEYFNAPDNLSRIATARRYKACLTVKQIRAMLAALPAETEIERRNRALIAFAILSGARDSAIISFKLKHIDVENELIEHDARDVRTKRAKTFTTWFFQSATTFARSSSIGFRTFARKRASVRRTRSSLNRRSGRTTILNSQPSASIALIGRTPTRFGIFFAKRAHGPACPISSLTRFETHWCNSLMTSSLTPSTAKPGRKTSATTIV